MATLGDVAQAAGVSVSVVSRVLNDDPALRARDQTRDRVRAVAAELGYTPNHAARSLRLSRAGTIALLLPDIGSPIAADMMRGAEEGANASELHVLLGRSEQLREGSADLQRLLAAGRVDGFIIQLDDGADVQDFERVVQPSTPIVLVHMRGSRHASVVLDDMGGGRRATEHLIDLGHTQIGLIGGLSNSHTGQRREQGFNKAMSAAGLPRRRAWITNRGYRRDDGLQAVQDLLASKKLPTGLVVANINAAFGVMQALRESNIDVPDELSVITIHDFWFAEYLTPKLTAVQMPLYELGLEGVRLLMACMAGEQPQNRVVAEPKPKLIERASTAAPRGGG